MSNRPAIPAELKRQVLVEAGHRCAIPTCRYPTTEIAHIVPYAQVQKHEYANLIALCPNCHTRFDKGEIDRKSMLLYKQKIIFISDRYSKFELNVLDYLAKNEKAYIHGYLQVKNLLDDELIARGAGVAEYRNGELTGFTAVLTQKGKEFLDLWADRESSKLTYE